MARILLLAAIGLLPACGDDGGGGDGDADTDTDTDSDSDSDSDSDTDTDPGSPTLTVVVSGAGAGTVVSDVGGIACRKDAGSCDADFLDGTQVVLSATPDTGFVFHGFFDACSGGLPCTVTVDGEVTVHAAFVPILFDSGRARDGTDAVDPDGAWRIWSVRTDGTAAAPVLGVEADGASQGEVRWSRDGERLAYIARTGSGLLQYQQWIANADGTDATNLVGPSDASGGNAAWSPDGTKVAFFSSEDPSGGGTALDASNVWIANVDGSGIEPVTTYTAAHVAFPHFSPDGTKLVFSSTAPLDGSDEDGAAQNLWTVDVDGTDLAPVTSYTAGILLYPRSSGGFSSLGTSIVFWSTAALDGSDAGNPGGVPNIWVVDTDGSDLRALTAYTATGVYPDTQSWSPDGATILFESNGALDGSDALAPNGAYNLWTVSLDGTGLAHLTRAIDGWNGSGVYSADGSEILYSSTRNPDGAGQNVNGTTNVWVMRADGTAEQAVTTLGADLADTGSNDW